MKKLSAAALLLAAACASSPGVEPSGVPAPQAAEDPRVGELQTQVTELLERIDVLNSRIARLEEGAVAPAPAVVTESRPAPDSRRAEPATAPPPRPVPAAPSGSAQQAVVGAQIAESYRDAIMLFGRGRQTDARSGFESVYQADPNGDLADNALFWIGETYFAAKDYTNAVRYYQRVVSDYAGENKAPDALFKIAVSQERTGDLALARRTLQQVIEKYPYSSSASTAKAELQRIRY